MSLDGLATKIGSPLLVNMSLIHRSRDNGLQLVNPDLNVLNFGLDSNTFSLTFSSIPGASYRVESAESPAGPWATVAPSVVAASVTTSWSGPVSPDTAPGRRFFRVRKN